MGTSGTRVVPPPEERPVAASLPAVPVRAAADRHCAPWAHAPRWSAARRTTAFTPGTGLFREDPYGLVPWPFGRDRATPDGEQVTEMLTALRQGLIRRYGTADEAAIERAARLTGRINVPVSFHVLTDGRRGRMSREAVRRQIAVLNAAYSGRGRGSADTGVRFRLVSYDVTVNAAWFRRPHRYERPMKSALRRGGAETLNLYSAGVGARIIGLSTYPHNYRARPIEDGVVVDYRSFPGGVYRNYSRGYTAVHEVGHWLGLFHTFENGCNSPGDGVDDTPYQAVPTDGCPESKDTCPEEPGADPVHNFMDYTWDTCMHQFTPGQGRRIRASWLVFRTSAADAR
ncbi:Pregnancy-associated plasma protein-A [Thermomonospora echinospora]|uniref:Pregnancy-associated plasma protein-A n=1 Tax=Thermomonospora echinospora TaxID=1992 RepID=A0A1H5VTC6_9ACTN|nr:zinc metalloprotease [Thermomonospora echinospora]SEF90490.1 Pregnancy-associated plasma protein-A [Thermomonospora echinospora]